MSKTRAASVDLEPYARAWRERFAAVGDRRRARRDAARQLLPQLVDRLVQRFGAVRVWAFGSLIEGGFHERSDIDLAVEGLPGDATLFRAAVELDTIAAPFEIDLVPIEDASATVRQRILERGELLYGTRPA